MKKYAVLLYGIISYLISLGVFVYLMGFIGNIIVENSIDSNPTKPMWYAIFVNVSLLIVFALQHSVMARPSFKRFWTKVIPIEAERSTYVLFSSLAMVILFSFWEPIGGLVWDFTDPMTQDVLTFCYFFGWGMLFFATCLINHFDLFGLRQVWSFFRGKTYQQPPFKTPLMCAFVRHLTHLAWLMIFWFTPTMTYAHLLLALFITIYVLIAMRLKERNILLSVKRKKRQNSENKSVLANKVFSINLRKETVKSPYQNKVK